MREVDDSGEPLERFVLGKTTEQTNEGEQAPKDYGLRISTPSEPRTSPNGTIATAQEVARDMQREAAAAGSEMAERVDDPNLLAFLRRHTLKVAAGAAALGFLAGRTKSGRRPKRRRGLAAFTDRFKR